MIHHPIDVAEMMHAAGWTSRERRAVAVAVCWAESRFDDQAVNENFKKDAAGNIIQPPVVDSVDRGFMQINSKWQPQVTPTCAFDPVCNIREARKIFVARDYSFSAWNAYVSGAYEVFMPEAYIAVDAALRIRAQERADAKEQDELQEEIDTAMTQLAAMRETRLALEARVVELESTVALCQEKWMQETKRANALESLLDTTSERLALADEEIIRLNDRIEMNLRSFEEWVSELRAHIFRV